MAVKIRLQRHGKKGKPFYYIVVADSRARRDGKFIEKLGTYNPVTNPATIELNVDRSVEWLQNGAQPTDTARAILSYKGALLKKHLLGGVKKGAFDMAEAEKRFNAWLEEKQKSIQAKIDRLASEKQNLKAARLQAEKKSLEAKLAAQSQVETSAENEVAVEDIAENTMEVSEAASDATDAIEGTEE